jgi:hypothetical protein
MPGLLIRPTEFAVLDQTTGTPPQLASSFSYHFAGFPEQTATAASIFKMIYKDAQSEGARAGYKIDPDDQMKEAAN